MANSNPAVAMKRLVFGEDLMEPTLDGNKRFTVRKYREVAHDFKKNDIIIGEFKDGLDILLRVTDDTFIETFKHLKRSQKTAESKGGYHFDEAYFNDLKLYYPDLTWDILGAVIQYEVLKVNGVSVVELNKYGRGTY